MHWPPADPPPHIHTLWLPSRALRDANRSSAALVTLQSSRAGEEGTHTAKDEALQRPLQQQTKGLMLNSSSPPCHR